MPDMSEFLTAGRRGMAAAILFVAVTTAALAQNVVVMVNGEPITALDIEQRSKFIQLSSHKTPARQEVLDELIDEKLKVKEAKRWGIEATDAEVDNQYASMGKRMQLTADQLTQNLAKSGVNSNTLKMRIRADIVWQQLVRGRYQASLQLTDKEVLNALDVKKPEDAEMAAMDYYLRPILLLVPPGSPPAVVENRRKEADGLRSRFKSCEEGVPMTRALRDAAVRDQVIRNSADLTPELRKILDSVPIGQLTAPEVTRLGVEMFAVCAKQESKADTLGKRQAREAMLNQRFDQQSKRYLRQLRRDALIERR